MIGTDMAAIDWPAAIVALDAGELPCSGGEGRILPSRRKPGRRRTRGPPRRHHRAGHPQHRHLQQGRAPLERTQAVHLNSQAFPTTTQPKAHRNAGTAPTQTVPISDVTIRHLHLRIRRRSRRRTSASPDSTTSKTSTATGCTTTAPGAAPNAGINAEFERIRNELADLPGTIADPARLRTMLDHLSTTVHPGVLGDCFYRPETTLCHQAGEAASQSAANARYLPVLPERPPLVGTPAPPGQARDQARPIIDHASSRPTPPLQHAALTGHLHQLDQLIGQITNNTTEEAR